VLEKAERTTSSRGNWVTEDTLKSPAEADFDVSVEESGAYVIFKPTNKHYSFYRLADAEDVERHGPLSLSSVRHSGKSGDTAEYISHEVQEIAVRLATSAALAKPA
jgi:hypothetical protein